MKETPCLKQNQPAGGSLGEHAGGYDANKIVPADGKNPTTIILEIIGLVALAALAGLFGATGHIVLSIWCVWGILSSALALTAQNILKSKPNLKNRTFGICGFLFCLITAWFLIWSHLILYPDQKRSAENPMPQPKRGLVFVVASGTNEEFRLPLTNDFLQVTDFDKPFSVGGTLILPKPEKGPANLEIYIINDSDILAEHIEVAVSIPKSLKCVPDSGWVDAFPSHRTESAFLAKNGTNIATDEVSKFACVIPDRLSGDSSFVPNLKFFPDETVDSIPWPVEIIAKAKDLPVSSVAFGLIFSNSVDTPVLISGSFTTNHRR